MSLITSTTTNTKADSAPTPTDPPPPSCSSRDYLIKKYHELEEDGVSAWLQMYKRLRQDADRQECDWDFKTTHAMSMNNFTKNRYRDVLPYDHSRVALRHGSHDYVNACMVPVTKANREYILSQGPLSSTSADFWQMVWEQNSHLVIMLNKLYEKNQLKCHMYYPVDDEQHRTLTFGRFQVTLESEERREHYTVRNLVLRKMSVDENGVIEESMSCSSSSTSESDDGSKEEDIDEEDIVDTDDVGLIVPQVPDNKCDIPDAPAENQTDSDEKKSKSPSPPAPAPVQQNGSKEAEDESLPPPPLPDDIVENTGSKSNGSTATSSIKSQTAEVRRIKHFQYTMWPDFGVPDSTDVRKSGLLDHRNHGPAVVHCSAGIGRSGTFVLVDSVLAMIVSNPNLPRDQIDIYKVVLEMRRFRMGLIQTYEQLRFSWQAVADALTKLEWEDLLQSHCVPEAFIMTFVRSSSADGSPKRKFDRLSGNQLCHDVPTSNMSRWISVDGSELSPSLNKDPNGIAEAAKRLRDGEHQVVITPPQVTAASAACIFPSMMNSNNTFRYGSTASEPDEDPEATPKRRSDVNAESGELISPLECAAPGLGGVGESTTTKMDTNSRSSSPPNIEFPNSVTTSAEPNASSNGETVKTSNGQSLGDSGVAMDDGSRRSLPHPSSARRCTVGSRYIGQPSFEYHHHHKAAPNRSSPIPVSTPTIPTTTTTVIPAISTTNCQDISSATTTTVTWSTGQSESFDSVENSEKEPPQQQEQPPLQQAPQPPQQQAPQPPQQQAPQPPQQQTPQPPPQQAPAPQQQPLQQKEPQQAPQPPQQQTPPQHQAPQPQQPPQQQQQQQPSRQQERDKRQALVESMRQRLAASERDRIHGGRLGAVVHRVGLTLGYPDLDQHVVRYGSWYAAAGIVIVAAMAGWFGKV